MLDTWMQDSEQAVLHAEIYRLDSHRNNDGDIAAALLRSLYNRFPRRYYKEGYEKITGEVLPEIDPLPVLVEFTPETRVDLVALEQRLGKIALEVVAEPQAT
ncbi:MAG: hypothetical protein M1281_15700 [Chloroflexi bacterium]|nr:hypothetical protein [Chloroflexota bacterium]